MRERRGERGDEDRRQALLSAAEDQPAPTSRPAGEEPSERAAASTPPTRAIGSARMNIRARRRAAEGRVQQQEDPDRGGDAEDQQAVVRALALDRLGEQLGVGARGKLDARRPRADVADRLAEAAAARIGGSSQWDRRMTRHERRSHATLIWRGMIGPCTCSWSRTTCGWLPHFAAACRRRRSSPTSPTTGWRPFAGCGPGRFDVVVLDVMLPGLDGFETCRRLRANGVWVPIIMLTARDAVQERVRGLDAGRRRLPDQAVLPRRAARAAARARSPRRGRAAQRARGRRSAARPVDAPGVARRRRDRVVGT